MSAVIRKTRADLRRRKLQFAIILLVVALSSFAGTLALSLLVEVSGPFDRAFQRANGAHLVMTFDSSRVTAGQVQSTSSLSPVSSATGPYKELGLGISFGAGLQFVTIQERDRPDTAVDRLSLDAGRWVQAPGEIVVSRQIEQHGFTLDSVVTPDSQSGMPPLKVVGIATGVADRTEAWVFPGQLPNSVAAPVPGKPAPPASYTMYYRLHNASTDADINSATTAISASLSQGSVLDTQSYLQIKRQAAITEAVMIPFLLALGVFALVASALIVANVVTGAVIANSRELGIMKAVGFTPAQLTAGLLAQVLLPAVIGCLAGIPLGIFASQPFIADAAQAFGFPMTFDIAAGMDILCLAGVLSIVAVAALIPALRAGRIPAAQVIATAMSPRTDTSARFNLFFVNFPLPRPLTLGGALSFARPLRSGITLVAVLLGVASVTFASGLAQSLNMVAASLTRTNQVQVDVQRQSSSDAQISQLIQSQPGTARFVAQRETDVTMTGVGQPVAFYSYHGDSSWIGYAVIHGRWFHGPGEAVAPTALMSTAHLNVGDSTTVTIDGKKVQLRIVGVILDQTRDNMLLRADWSNLASVDPTAEANQYEVQLKPGTSAEAYARQLMDAAPANAIFADQNGSRGADSAFLLIDSALAGLAIVLVAIAASGVFNTVVLNTREKARDIAILKAVGMTPRQTVTVVLASVAILGVLGGLVGIPAGIALHSQILSNMAQIASRTELPASFYAVFSPAVLAIMALSGLAVALVGAFIPAQWAARSRTMEVLHAE